MVHNHENSQYQYSYYRFLCLKKFVINSHRENSQYQYRYYRFYAKKTNCK